MQARSGQGNTALAAALVVLAIVFAAGAIFYFTATTSLLASESGRHYKHGILCAGLAVVSLIGANFARNMQRS